MAAPPVLSRFRNMVTVLSRYSDILPSLAAPASSSPPGVLQDIPTGFLFGFHPRAPCHATVVDACGSYAPYGLAALVPSGADMQFCQLSPSLIAEDMAWSARPHIFAGLAAGAGIISGYVFSQENPDDNRETNAAVPSPGNAGGMGGAGRNGGGGDDEERYRLILKLLLELCQRDDNCEELRDKFQQLKCLMQKEWYVLHKKREALNAKEILVETDREKNRAQREKLDADSDRLKELSSEIDKREAELEQRLRKRAVDEAKFRDDRGVLDEQLRQADLDSKELAEKLYRADLDGKTVKDMWADLRAEQARMAAADLGKEEEGGKTGKEGGKTTGLGKEERGAGKDGGKSAGTGKEEEGHRENKAGEPGSGVWSQFCKVINYPMVFTGMKDWCLNTWFALTFGSTFVTEIPNMDRSTFSDVKGKIMGMHDDQAAESKKVLVKWGLKKSEETEE